MFKKSITAVFIFLLTFTAFASIGGKATFAAGGISLYTPYTGISVTPGESIDYSVDLINNTGNIQQVSFNVKGLPEKWEYKLTSSGWKLNQLAAKPGESQTFSLTVNVPLKVDKGEYSFALVANGNGVTEKLPLTVTVSEQGTFKTQLAVDQPNLQGQADSDFTYTATLKNRTAEEQRYALTANAPKGWNVVFQSDGKNVTSVKVEPGSSKDIEVTLTPPNKVKAGNYKVRIKASSGSTSAKNVLEAVITGTYDIQLTTPTGRLSADITAGDQETVKLQIVNKGSAPLHNVKLDATTPPEWEVHFDPEKIAEIAPGKKKTVKATITASDNAIAGDYVVKMKANADEASDSAEFRISVKTSLLWGWVGVLVVIAVLAGIYYLFRTYGRR
ncbi:MAG TPA: NEW3 domain-containing protein [Bacillales bacterium]